MYKTADRVHNTYMNATTTTKLLLRSNGYPRFFTLVFTPASKVPVHQRRVRQERIAQIKNFSILLLSLFIAFLPVALAAS